MKIAAKVFGHLLIVMLVVLWAMLVSNRVVRVEHTLGGIDASTLSQERAFYLATKENMPFASNITLTILGHKFRVEDASVELALLTPLLIAALGLLLVYLPGWLFEKARFLLVRIAIAGVLAFTVIATL